MVYKKIFFDGEEDILKKLTALERIKRTLEFKDTDRVATGEIIQNSDIISCFAGRKVNGDWTLEELVKTYQGLEIDVGMLIAPAAKPKIEERIGLKYQVTFWSEWVVERPFSDVEGLKKYIKWMIDEVKKSEPECMWSYAGKGGIVGQDFSDYRNYFINLKKMFGSTTIPCHIESPVGLDTMYNISGFELFSYMLVDDPGLVSEWFDVLNEHELNRVHLIADKEISPLVVVYCDIASNNGPIFSPTFLRKDFFPRVKKLVDAWHEHGVKVIYHSEGNLKPVMDDLIKCGIDGINPCEKRNMSLEYVRSHYPSLVIWGGIDSFDLIPKGMPDEVEQEVRNVIDICKNGGLILGSDGQVHPSSKAENVIAMFDTAKKYKF